MIKRVKKNIPYKDCYPLIAKSKTNDSIILFFNKISGLLLKAVKDGNIFFTSNYKDCPEDNWIILKSNVEVKLTIKNYKL